jgi:hypothetical protein
VGDPAAEEMDQQAAVGLLAPDLFRGPKHDEDRAIVRGEL